MKQAPAKFARAVAGLSPNQMRKRPARGKWSIVEILGHLQDTEVVYGYRLRFSLAQPGANLEGYGCAGLGAVAGPNLHRRGGYLTTTILGFVGGAGLCGAVFCAGAGFGAGLAPGGATDFTASTAPA